MASVEINLTCNLQTPVKVQYIDGNMFSLDNAGNTINVLVFNGEEPAELGGSVAVSVIRSDGATVAVSGAISGNKAYAILPQSCYAVPGVVSVVVKNVQDTTVTTLAAFVANVYQTSTETTVDPGTIIPSISALIAQIEAAVGSIPADYSALLATIAADYSSSKTYPTVGAYAWCNGVLRRSIVPITTAETYNSAHWTDAVIGDDLSALKSALNQIWSDQIVGMTPTERQKESVNLFTYAELVGAGKAIYSISNGKVTLSDNASYNTYLLPVDGESTYTFTNCRTAVLVSDLSYTAVSQLLTYVTSVNSTGGEYIIFSFNPTTYPITSYKVTKPVAEYVIPNNWNLGDFEVETQQINGMLPTGNTVESSNLFSKASLVASGKYVDHITNGKAVLSDNASYDTYIIPVDSESTYTFTNCRTAVVVSDLEYTAVGSLLNYATEINSTGGTYILFSFNPTTYPVTSYKVTKPVAEYTIPNNWNLDKGAKTGYQRKIGSIASGGSLALTGKTAIKYGYQIIFKAFISAFNEIKLAFYNYNNSAISNAINITATDLVIYVGNSAVQTLPHGLTIANDISLVLDYRSDGVKVTLYSNGGSFSTETTFERLTSGVVSPSIISTGTVCTSAVFEMTVPRSKKPVWYFGDSYISFANTARWAYYLVHDGFDGNTLLNGYAGGTSATTVMALTALLEYGTPKYAVFATGMNDGSDSDSAPSTSWVNARNNFISLCENNGIEMIFATVPTVPTVNNEAKNAWVRASGYRYIDFASAVGADGTGAWYSGMLSTDNVHPTGKGAKALYTQVLTDFPEVLMP